MKKFKPNYFKQAEILLLICVVSESGPADCFVKQN